MSSPRQKYEGRVLPVFLLRASIHPAPFNELNEKNYNLAERDYRDSMREKLEALLGALNANPSSPSLMYRFLAFQAAMRRCRDVFQQCQADVEATLQAKQNALQNIPQNDELAFEASRIKEDIEQLKKLLPLITARATHAREDFNSARKTLSESQDKIKTLMTAHQKRSWGRRVLEFLGAAWSSGALPTWVLGGFGGLFAGMGVPAAIAAIAAGAAVPIMGAVFTAVLGAVFIVAGITVGVRAFKRTEREIAKVAENGLLFEEMAPNTKDSEQGSNASDTPTPAATPPSVLRGLPKPAATHPRSSSSGDEGEHVPESSNNQSGNPSLPRSVSASSLPHLGMFASFNSNLTPLLSYAPSQAGSTVANDSDTQSRHSYHSQAPKA